ncbi:hypothetical protein AB0H64_01920 [Nonomuraea sp. NPDC050733]
MAARLPQDFTFLPGVAAGIILSKAFLLAADTTITDPSVTRQTHL